jgi:nucleoside-diphosphate-sugar epimerase
MNSARGRGIEAGFLVTGATGFLGSHLMAALVRRGERVVALGRCSQGNSLTERVTRQLAWFGLADRADLVTALEADLLKPQLGLKPACYRALCSQSPCIVHLASDTRFARNNRENSLATNVHSLEQMIEFAGAGRAPFFHYVSTAYVAQAGSQPCLEEPVRHACFANVYEETKAQAESEVMRLCSSHGVPYTILRPSIVYGDAATGRSNSFTALYHHVKALQLIKGIYLADIENQGGAKARASGIRLGADGILELPIRIYLAHQGFVNLIPIDYFVAAALAVIERPRSGGVYHLTSGTPSTMKELAEYCERFLKVRGIEICYGEPPAGYRPNPAESLFNKMIEPYRPYLCDIRVFDRSNLDAAAPGHHPPRLSYPIFERCMQYAVSVDWGNSR